MSATHAHPVALITGASRGIGACTAIALAEAGYDVVITARTMKEGERVEHGSGASNTDPLPGSLEATAAAVAGLGRRALPLRADILEPDTVLAAVDRTLEEFGRLDLLFNNACYQGPGNMNRVLDITREQIGAIYQGNVFTPMATIQRALPAMLKQGAGTIINMVSGSALIDPPAPADAGGWGFAYSSSKAALIRMAGVLRVEHADSGLRFINVEPGFVLTEVMKANGLDDAIAKRFNATRPEAIAAVIRWLCEDPGAADWEEKTVVHMPQLAKQLNF